MTHCFFLKSFIDAHYYVISFLKTVLNQLAFQCHTFSLIVAATAPDITPIFKTGTREKRLLEKETGKRRKLGIGIALAKQ